MLAVLPLAFVLAQQPAVPVPAFEAPSKDGVELTPDQLKTAREGLAFHNQGRFDDAIAKYQAVLADNPAAATIWYEMAFSYSGKKDYRKTIEVAAKGAVYKSAVLGSLYVVSGSAFDSLGQPNDSVAVYRKGLEFAPDNVGLYYNLAVTYANSLNDRDTAKAVLKQGAVVNPNHASTQLLLAQFFKADEHRALALLALSRFLILEPGSQRTGDAYNAWLGLLNGGVTQTADGKMEIGMAPNVKPDEGNFTQMDLFISLSKISAQEAATPADRFAKQLTRLFEVYAKQAPGADAATFGWTYYLSYFGEMSRKDLVEPFFYFVSQRTNIPGVREYLAAHGDRLKAFVDWNKAYAWPKR